MKKVVSAQIIKDIYKQGKRDIQAPPSDFIVTPEARTVAKDLGIQIVNNISRKGAKTEKSIDEALVRKVVSKIYERLPDAHNRADEVRNAVIEVLSDYIR